jgi:DNA replication and repair protein RecF
LLLNFSSKFVVFYGENGAGKTNVLEAISMFSSGRGLRKAPMADLNSVSSPDFSWRLELVLHLDGYKTFLSTAAPGGRRVAKIDNSNINSLSKFEEIFWLLWVAPGMDSIFSGQGVDRRGFFDHLVTGYDKEHKARMKNLNTLQKERLQVIFWKKDERWLQVLEEKIAMENVKITKARLEFIELLHRTFADHPSDFLRPKISISGAVEKIYEAHSEESALLEMAAALKKQRFEDAERQTTQTSALRTFWRTTHDKTNLEATNCSMGEQKAFLISLILAVARIYRSHRAGIPTLLLDDLLVHLDEVNRRKLVRELISIDVQTFFTGTDLDLFSDLSDVAQVYHVEKSICTPV